MCGLEKALVCEGGVGKGIKSPGLQRGFLKGVWLDVV